MSLPCQTPGARGTVLIGVANICCFPGTGEHLGRRTVREADWVTFKVWIAHAVLRS